MGLNTPFTKLGLNTPAGRRGLGPPPWAGGLTPDVRWDFTEGAKNLLAWSEDGSKSVWESEGSGTVSVEVGAAPDGSDAIRMDVAKQYDGIKQNTGVELDAGTIVSSSVWIKRLSGNTSLTLRHTPTGTEDSKSITITDEWAQYSFEEDLKDSTGGVSLLVQDRNGSGYGSFLIWHPQINQGPLKAYHKTTDRDTLPAIIGGSQYAMQLGSSAGADTNDPSWEPTIGLGFDGTNDQIEGPNNPATPNWTVIWATGSEVRSVDSAGGSFQNGSSGGGFTIAADHDISTAGGYAGRLTWRETYERVLSASEQQERYETIKAELNTYSSVTIP